MEIHQLLQSDLKHKEKVSKIVSEIEKDNKLFTELVELLQNGSDVIKGTCAEVMKFVSQKNPELFLPYINLLIDYIDYEANRVKWGIPESIGYLAEKYPVEVEKAVPKLMENTKDKSTVVRWCAAFGLAGIAKHNINIQEELVKKFEELIEKEQNNGVRNVYLKTLKEIEKERIFSDEKD